MAHLLYLTRSVRDQAVPSAVEDVLVSAFRLPRWLDEDWRFSGIGEAWTLRKGGVSVGKKRRGGGRLAERGWGGGCERCHA